MEDYIRGVLCGKLQVQNGTQDNAKRTRTFVVLSDSRMDYYLTDPRPTFAAKIDATYFLTEKTRVNFYLELNARAPPHSICLTTDKTTDVYIADTQEEADIWFRHISERLEAISMMLKGILMLRKELPANQQVKRFVLRTKYRWKARYVELGRSTLRFCKPSDRKTKTMKQFTLTVTSFAGQESTTYLRQLSIFASYSIPVDPTPQTLKGIEKIEKMRREEEDQNQVDTSLKPNEVRPKGSSVAAFYPFIVTTGQAYIMLAAPTEQIRTHWILAIRLRIIALKYHHKGEDPLQSGLLAHDNPYQLQSFVEAQPTPGGPWKQHYVELDNCMLRVKKSERKLGSILEVHLVPNCRVTPLLEKANAFTVRSLGCEVSFAPGSATESRRWIDVIRSAATAVGRARYQKIFQEDIQNLIRHSVVYALDIPAGANAGITLEKHKKRIFVLNHEKPSVPKLQRRVSIAAIGKRASIATIARRMSIVTAATSSFSAKTRSPSSSSPADSTVDTVNTSIIPEGSVLVGILQLGMTQDSVDTIWHTIRHKKGCNKKAKRLLFRAPAVKVGVLRVKLRAVDEWELLRCRLANGTLCVDDPQTSNGEILTEVALRSCEVELFSDDDCVNGIRLSVPTSARTVVLLNVPADADAFHWFAILHMEISIAQDSSTFPLTAAMLANNPVTTPPSGTPSTRMEKLAADQARNYRECTIVGTRIEEIDKHSREQEKIHLKLADELRKKQEKDQAFVKPETTHRTVRVSESKAALSNADVTHFFQHLEADGSGKVSSTDLAETMKDITKHIRYRATHHQLGCQENDPATTDTEPLDEFFNALKVNGHDSLTLEEFATVMAKVTHPAIVELVRKVSHNNIQRI
ncbi:hypothetical protein P3T76_003119 [Phytophthora citrophthora]|uniref:Uncharacterized protein n=1 Tax=Phytophthora citrophthora TaxID=4793 RepID=A0AAD9LRN5_9STRA|nr:hypothetical protein P3T76_003119 [Phytophthora citrophthora]